MTCASCLGRDERICEVQDIMVHEGALYVPHSEEFASFKRMCC